MWNTLLPVVGFWFTRERDKAVIDDIPFQLQYIWTTSFLFLSSVLISLTELVGKHVQYIPKYFIQSDFSKSDYAYFSIFETFNDFYRIDWQKYRRYALLRQIQ